MGSEPRAACALAKVPHLSVEAAAAQAIATFTRARLLVGVALFHAEQAYDAPHLFRIAQAEQIEIVLNDAFRTVFEFAEEQLATELEFMGHRVQVRNETRRCEARQGRAPGKLPEQTQGRAQTQGGIGVDVEVAVVRNSLSEFGDFR